MWSTSLPRSIKLISRANKLLMKYSVTSTQGWRAQDNKIQRWLNDAAEICLDVYVKYRIECGATCWYHWNVSYWWYLFSIFIIVECSSSCNNVAIFDLQRVKIAEVSKLPIVEVNLIIIQDSEVRAASRLTQDPETSTANRPDESSTVFLRPPFYCEGSTTISSTNSLRSLSLRSVEVFEVLVDFADLYSSSVHPQAC